MKKLNLDKQEADFLNSTINHWQSNGIVNTETAEQLKNSYDVKEFDWRRLAQYSFWVALACGLIAFASLVIDDDVLDLLARRMKLSEEIGKHKKHNRISILQLRRWNEILEKAKDMGRERGLSEGFISNYLSAVHQESISKQANVQDDEA